MEWQYAGDSRWELQVNGTLRMSVVRSLQEKYELASVSRKNIHVHGVYEMSDLNIKLANMDMPELTI